MLYEYDLTVPAATTKASPATLEALLAPGTVSLVGIQFPRGCRGLVSTSIFRSNHQVWPGDPDTAIKADGIVVQWPEDYDLDDDPFSFQLRAWSPNAVFPHTLTFRFSLLPLGATEEARQGPGLLRRIASLLGVK